MTEKCQAPALHKLAYKIKEAASATSISVAALYEDIAAGRLPVRKRGRATLILADDLATYLRALPGGRTQ